MRLVARRNCRWKSGFIVPLVALAVLFFGGSPTVAETGDIAIELNKLEPHDRVCRAYFVIENQKDTQYDALKLDLVLFRPDGVIGKRFAVELAPLKAKKRAVKLFDVADTACDEVGSFLINDVIKCQANSSEMTDCLQDISVSSRTENELSK